MLSILVATATGVGVGGGVGGAIYEMMEMWRLFKLPVRTRYWPKSSSLVT